MEPQIIELNGKKYKVTYEEIKEPVSGFHREKRSVLLGNEWL